MSSVSAGLRSAVPSGVDNECTLQDSGILHRTALPNSGRSSYLCARPLGPQRTTWGLSCDVAQPKGRRGNVGPGVGVSEIAETYVYHIKWPAHPREAGFRALSLVNALSAHVVSAQQKGSPSI
eukprot:1189975-Prorocentrum_minimum.AAC.2